MKQLIILVLFTISAVAYGSIYTRQHSATIVNGKKILASDLNDEFNAIATAVNNIDGSNVTNGSLGVNVFAATSSAVSLNKKSGCTFSTAQDITGTKTIEIAPPCEIFIDGTRGYITATQSISLLSDLVDGSLATANFYYIYATRNSSAALTFTFSQEPPILATARKLTDSSARYVGTVRTCDATTDIVTISTRKQAPNHFAWSPGLCNGAPDDSLTGLIATANTVSAPNLTVPNTFKSLEMKATAYTDASYPAQCSFEATSFPAAHEPVVVATGGNVSLVPFGVLPSSGFTVQNTANCTVGGDLRVVGWWEPVSLHQ